ncbi:MAG: hypothetical protein IKG80_01175 [Clostridia bacterium]|nr:hypothetical protein [Clostridia bacterium]
MTEKSNLKKERKEFALSALVSAGVGAGFALLIAVLSSAFILFTPEPSAFYFPVGLVALYAGSAASGFIMMKKTGVPSASLLPSAAIAAIVAIAGAFVKGRPVGPAPLTVALYLLIPAAGLTGALIASGKKKKRPSFKRRPQRRR